MATATNLGPIGINQINSVFYVGGDGGFPNIQAAVDYAQKYNAGLGHVTITHGYSGSEAMSSIVRGSSQTYITDLRNTAAQNWKWSAGNAQFVPADFVQLADAHVGGLMKAFGFSPIDLTASHVSAGVGGLDPNLPVLTFINAAAPLNQKMWVMAAVPEQLYFSATADSGQDTAWMQVFRSGGAATKVLITPNMDVTGVLTSQGSPVRTFANSSGGGGGGTGGVNPGASGQLSFYEVDGPLLSPASITTDVATQSSLTVPTVVNSGQANTNTTSFADRTSANWQYDQEITTTMTGGGGVNLGSPWSVTHHGVDTMYHAQRGIAQLRVGSIERHAVGDTVAAYYYVIADGGIAAGSDEGVGGLGLHVWENAGYFHGTVSATSGYGDQAPTYTLTSGPGHTIDGAFMLNISKGQLSGKWNGNSAITYLDTGAGPTATFLNQLPITGLLLANIPVWSTSIAYAAGNIVSSGGSNYVSLKVGNKANTPATSPTQWAVLPAGQLPLSTAIGVATAGIPYNNAPTNQPASHTVTVNLVKIGGSFPAFAVNDVVWLASDEMPEQAVITAASAVTGTQQTLTMKTRNPSGGLILFKGGIQGQYISHDANLAFSQMRSSYYAFGSLTGNEVIYGHNVAGSLVGRVLPQTGAEAATSSGANSGFHLYPGAEVVCNPTFNYDGTLEQNGVRWEVGDAVENPHYPEFGGVGILLDKIQTTPSSSASGTSLLTLLWGGKGFCGGAQAINVRSNEPSTNFSADGGPVGAPGGIALTGFYSSGLQMSNAPNGPVINIDDPAAPVNNPNAVVSLIRVHYSGGGNLTYDPSTGNWNFSGNIAASNLSLVGGLTVQKGASFFNESTTPLLFNGTNDYKEIVFGNDGSGITQRIGAYINSGYPPSFNVYYDTIRGDWVPVGGSSGHVFRVSPYQGGAQAMVATIDATGIKTPGTISGSAYSVAGTAGVSGSYTTADSKTVTVTQGLITAIV